jgi:hypothetical protein
MIANCPHCGAELGPAEDPEGCLTCRRVRLMTNPDRVVAVLEKAPVPLAYWDVKRLLDKAGSPVQQSSVQVWLSTDWRPCWGGPGIYGLYRHGLLPGVRVLGYAAAVYIHAVEQSLTHDEARFILQYAGYRFQSISIYASLCRAERAGLLKHLDGYWSPTGRSTGPWLGLSHRVDTEAVMERAASQAADALAAFDGEG